MLKIKGNKLILLAASYSAALIFLSLVNLKNINPLSVSGVDKMAHAAAYAGLFWIWSLVMRLKNLRHPLLKAAVGSMVFGIILELCQMYLTNTRSLDPLDMIANTCGVGFSYLVLRITRRS